MPEGAEDPEARAIAVEVGGRQSCNCRWVGLEKDVEVNVKKDYEMDFRGGYVQDFEKYREVVEDMVHQKEEVMV